MKRLVVSLLLFVARGAGMSVDLGGEWRMSADDRPEYARPDYDDSGWAKVRLPWTARPPIDRIHWLRRAVDLPPELATTELKITLGPVAEVYELFLNGMPVAQVGAFDWHAAPIASNRTFAIPPKAAASLLSGQNRGRLQVAIRFSRTFGQRMSPLVLYEGGAYAITDAASTPADSNIALLNQHKVTQAPTLVTFVLLVSFGILFGLLWVADREAVTLLWLALFVTARGVANGFIYFAISLGSSPVSQTANWHDILVAFEQGDPGQFFVTPFRLITPSLLSFSYAALSQLILVEVGVKKAWVRMLFWGFWLTTLLVWNSPDFSIGGLIAAMAVLCFGWWRWRREGLMRHARFFLLFVAATIFINNLWVFLFPGSITFLGYSLRLADFATAVLSAIIAVLALHGLTLDRREKQRLANELEAARTMQQLLLPASGGGSDRFQSEAVYSPALEVGGDFHWYRVDREGALIVVTRDVSGKGLKAAMLVSVAVGILRNEKSRSPAAILGAMNDCLTGHTDGGFVTCCCARFDVDGTVTLANAGNPRPYSAGREVDMDDFLPLGVVAEAVYADTVIVCDALTFVSDGVIEAANAKGELFGFERTGVISTQPAKAIADAAKAWGQNDDITVVTVRRNA